MKQNVFTFATSLEDVKISGDITSRICRNRISKTSPLSGSDLKLANPDLEGFDIFLEFSKIQNYNTQSNEEKLKSKFSEELLNDISSISKPLKDIRYFVEKILPIL